MYLFIEISRDLLEKEALESKECGLNSHVVFPLQIQLPLTKSPSPYHRTSLMRWSLQSISACGVWEVWAVVQVSKREFHTHIHLDLTIIEFLFCI